MNSKVYKWCAVPQCKNTSISTPKKVFVHVPYKKTIRHKWLKLARRNPYDLVTNSPLYFCENHFDLPNDMINYMEYHVMGSVSQVRMKPGCMPKTFTCQPDWKPGISDTTERPYIAKKRKIMILEEAEKKLEEKSIVIEESSLEESVNSKPSSPNANVLCKIAKIEHSGSDTSYTPSTDTETSVSVKIERLNDPFEMDPTPDCNEMEKDDSNIEDLKSLECTLKKIKNSPYFYIGIPSSCYNIVNLIQEQTNIPLTHILICLKKIRLNNSFHELADYFGIDRTDASKIFLKNVPIITSVMRPFIVTFSKKIIEKQLPMAFRHRHNRVSCIIDCLEIEVQPSKVPNEALTYSEYKKAHTIKYLISCTPDGLINYISSGYGGRITDTSIVETSDFSKCLQPNMTVMADRVFKHVDVYLQKMGVHLVRPPSVASAAKLKAKENREIDSLRTHVQRVIGRLREFNMLKPHACRNSSLVKVLDDIVTIACGLINIQDYFVQ
nr:uncharacterized protein LOC110381940 [Helicoverpa armigera]